MRVHEIARALGISSRDCLKFAQRFFIVTSPSSYIAPIGASTLINLYKGV